MKINHTFLILVFLFSSNVMLFGQHVVMTIDKAKANGLLDKLEQQYIPALGSDTSTIVFKTTEQQNQLKEGYTKLLEDLGQFLIENNFTWEQTTRCFNRIYFDKNGSIDYFLYHFLGKKEVQPSVKQQKEFKRLLEKFVINHKISAIATQKFVQCSPATYLAE